MRTTCLILAGLLLSATAWAKFEVPWLSGPVVDEVGLLSPGELQVVEQKLHALKNGGTAQVQVFITKSLQGLPIEQASIEITDQWKLGDAKADNGILFLIAPSERKIRIEVGQGLEGTIPDAYAKRIVDDIVVPYFRQGQNGQGVIMGVDAIIGLLGGGELPAERRSSGVRQLGKGHLLFIILWILFFVFTRFGRGGGRGGGGSQLIAAGLGYGLGRSSSGGFGGGGGSSWGGGGGGFSGGGASGSW